MSSKHHLRPLSDAERDALTEAANIAMGRAATSLRHIVHEEVVLTVPSIDIISEGDVLKLMQKAGESHLIAVREDFRGLFSGRALLIFPETSSLELVRAIIGRDMSLEEIAELETEAIGETGNIVLNCWIATLANLLKHNLVMSVPKVIRGDSASIFESPSVSLVLFLHIDFAVRENKIRGYLALLMDLPSMDALRALIHDFIESFGRP